jgi:hypothetical protein
MGGNYTVTVRNAAGCTNSASVHVDTAMSLTSAKTNSLCSNGFSGSISVVAKNGTPPYSYLWGTGNTTSSITGLSAGAYTVRVTDANGCTSSVSNSIITAKATADYSFIGSNFNSTPIPVNSYLWFSCKAKINYTGSYPLTIRFTDQNINSARFNLLPVKGTLVITNSVTTATTVFNGVEWITTAPPDPNGEYFVSGMMYKVLAAINGNLNPVKWKGIWTSSSSCVSSIEWKWSASVYSNFAITPTFLEIKPIDASTGSLYNNTDPAGTPENYRAFLIAGARGTGGSEYTGLPSATGTRIPCSTPDVRNNLFSFKLNQNIDAEEMQEGKIPLKVNAYPNPFSSSTTIVFEKTDKSDHVVVEVYTMLGRLVRRLFDAQVEQGVEYRVEFNGEEFSDGIYLYKVFSGDKVEEGKLILKK